MADELRASVTDLLSVLFLRLLFTIQIQLFCMWQLHNERRQLRHLIQGVEDCSKANYSINIASVGLLCSTAEM
jgi:hypothetical protein